MQVFEFHFNPPQKNKISAGQADYIFDTFCFEPKNIYERRIGGLYMAGLLRNILPQNARFLEILAEKIKDKYYKTASATPEKSLKEALRIANEYLEKVAREGDVSWLGNLSFSVVSLKNQELNFTKIGDFKTLLIRRGQMIDIDQGLKFNEIEPYPLKIFGNIVSGKLAEDDILLLLNNDVYQSFVRENLLNDLVQQSSTDEGLKEIKKFGNILNNKKEELARTSGACLLMILNKEEGSRARESFNENEGLKAFSFKEAFHPLLGIVKKIKLPSINLKKSDSSPEQKTTPTKQAAIEFRKEKRSFPSLNLTRFYPSAALKRKLTIIVILALTLTTGFFLFQQQGEINLRNYQAKLEQIKQKIELANASYIASEYDLRATKEANQLYQTAWQELSLLTNTSLRIPKDINLQAQELKDSIKENIYSLNKITEIENPELVFEFKSKDFVPQEMLYLDNKIYFTNSNSNNIFELNLEDKQERIIELNDKVSQMSISDETILLFSQPDKIIVLQAGEIKNTVQLQPLSSETNLDHFVSYFSNLYFTDKNNQTIIKYPQTLEFNWSEPEIWLKPETKTATDLESMTVDGSIWLLASNNSIDRYHTGQLQETINLAIFPESKNLTKIYTTLELPNFYLLEPEQKRIIVLDKTDQIIGQYQSEKFNNLLDFSISTDKTIWLLNGLKLYKITI
jgi:hypothetical protein